MSEYENIKNLKKPEIKKYIDEEAKQLYDRIYGLLGHGHEAGTSMRDLATLLDIPERNLRAIILTMRIKGYVIASDEYGYYIPDTIEEIKNYYHRVEKHIESTTGSIAAVKRIIERYESGQIVGDLVE